MQEALWLDQDNTSAFWNPEKKLTAPAMAQIEAALGAVGLKPAVGEPR